MFSTFDTGGRGRLDRKEIGALMEAAEMNVTAERVDFLFELMDKNSKLPLSPGSPTWAPPLV